DQSARTVIKLHPARPMIKVQIQEAALRADEETPVSQPEIVIHRDSIRRARVKTEAVVQNRLACREKRPIHMQLVGRARDADADVPAYIRNRGISNRCRPGEFRDPADRAAWGRHRLLCEGATANQSQHCCRLKHVYLPRCLEKYTPVLAV